MAGEVHTVAIDVIDRSIPIGNNRNIAVINKPNPVYGYEATAKEVAHLIQIPMYYIYEAGTPNIIDGTNYYDYFPEEGGGGGGGGGDISRYTVEKSTDGSTGEVTYDLIEQLNNGTAHKVGDVIGIRGSQMLVQYGSQLSILDTTLATIKEKIDATYNFTTFNELNITTSGKTLKQITDELYAKNLPTNTIVTGQLYTEALPFSGNGEAEVMINGSAFWWKCTSLNVAPYSWNAIAGGGSWSGVIMDWTPTYVTEEPMVFKGSAIITADANDPSKCSITVSSPATASKIKRGYEYKVTSIATTTPAYTGSIKVGDTIIADKNAPVVGPTWTLDTDWTVVPSGDEPEYTVAPNGGLQLTGEYNNEFGHSNTPITAKTELGITKIKYDALGHITESEDALTDTAVTGLVTATPTDPDPANKIAYYSYANERMTLHKIGYSTDNRFVSTKEPLRVVSRYVNFTTNDTTRTGNPDTHPVYMAINRCNVSDNGTINAYYGDAGYTEDGSNGQVMVKIPKFYYKVTPDPDGGLDGVNIRKCTWEISDSADDGFTLHPAFYDASGNEIDYFLYGAFDAVGQNSSGTYGTSYNTASDKLSSVAGSSMLPVNSLTRATARTMATNRGTGWYSAGVKQTMAVQMLMAVEYGFNSQITIGQGVVSASAATYAGRTTGNVTSGTQDNKTTPVNWRGIENFWGNIFDWIDGLNIHDRIPYFCNSYTFVDDTSSGYTQIGFNLASSSNLISALGYDSNNDWIMLPSEASGASDTSAIGDYVSSRSGWGVAPLGGDWNYDSNAGAFFWECFSTSSATASFFGARVMYIPSAV